jgi:hypothetical protein
MSRNILCTISNKVATIPCNFLSLKERQRLACASKTLRHLLRKIELNILPRIKGHILFPFLQANRTALITTLNLDINADCSWGKNESNIPTLYKPYFRLKEIVICVPHLKKLSLYHTHGINCVTLAPLKRAKNLIDLTLSIPISKIDLAQIAECRTLVKLSLLGCRRLWSFDCLLNCVNLKELTLINSPKYRNLNIPLKLTQLTIINFFSLIKLTANDTQIIKVINCGVLEDIIVSNKQEIDVCVENCSNFVYSYMEKARGINYSGLTWIKDRQYILKNYVWLL